MKRLLVLLMCFNIFLAPTYVFAGAAEKWEIVENIYDNTDQKVNITAKKITQAAANSGVYKVHVPVNASTLGSTVKMMLKGGIAAAGLYALVESVGWVIDEGSKVIKKIDEDIPDSCGTTGQNCPQLSNIWQVPNYPQFGTFSSALSAATYYFHNYTSPKPQEVENPQCTLNANGTATCTARIKNGYGYWVGTQTVSLSQKANPNYNPAYEPNYTIISDSQLGNEILGNGIEPNSSTVPRSAMITEAYSPNNPISDAPAPKESNDALENSNPEPETDPKGDTAQKPNVDTDGDGVPDAYDPAQPSQGEEFTLPSFCEWAPAVCDFFSVQKADNKEIKQNQKDQLEQDKTFYEKASEFFDSFSFDGDLPENESPEIADLPIPELKEDAVSWAAQCPNDVQVPINMQGVSSTITFSWSPWCQLLSIIKPAIVASAYIGAAFIVLGLRT